MEAFSVGDEVRFARSPELIGDKASQSEHAYHPDYLRTKTPRQRKLRMQVIVNRQGLIELNLSDYDLRQIPDETFNFHRLEAFKIGKNRLHSIPNNISHLRKLKVLDAHQNSIVALADTITNCTHLQDVNLSHNRLSSLPNHISMLRNLKVLKLNHNQFESLPHELGDVESLRQLELSQNKLWHLPFSFQGLINIRHLDLSHNAFDQLPICVCSMRNMEALNLQGNRLINLPNDVENLKYIKELNLAANRFETVPYAVSTLKSLQSLDISQNRLKNLPARIAKLTRLKVILAQNNSIGSLPNNLEMVEYLNLADNKLNNFSVAHMKKLKHLNANHNKLENLPLGVCNLPNLESLKLNSNKISYVSQDIILLKKIRTLDFGNNRLTSLPSVINELENLESFNIKGNKIETRIHKSHHHNHQKPAHHQGRSQERSPREKSPQRPGELRPHPLYKKRNGEAGIGEVPQDEATHNTKPKLPHHYSKMIEKKEHSTQVTPHSRTNAATQYTPKSSAKLRDRPPLDYRPKATSLPSFFSYPRSAKSIKSNKTQGGASDPTAASIVTHAPSRVTHAPSGGTSHFAIGPHSLPNDAYLTLPMTPSEITYPMDVYSVPGRSVRSKATVQQSYTQAWVEGPKKRLNMSIKSNAATVNDTVGDNLSLGEEDFEYQPITVTDHRLLGVCSEVEAMLNKQLLHPIIANKGIFKKGLNEYGTLRTLNGLHTANTKRANTKLVKPESELQEPELQEPELQEGEKVKVSEEPLQVNEEIFMKAADDEGVPSLLSRTKADVFQVTPAGGQFKSSVDPNVSIYFPVQAVDDVITVHMQIETVNPDALQIAKKENELIENIASMGHIVHITLGHQGAQFNEQVTLTIPAPPTSKAKKGRLQILTYLDDNTCTPCTSPYKSYQGYISLQSWHFSGKGAVLTKSRDKYKACKAVEQLLESMSV